MSETPITPDITSVLALPPQSQMLHFTILKVLAQGGFGITYLVYDQHLNCQCVMKENMPHMFCERDPSTMRVYAKQGQEAQNSYAWALEQFRKEAQLLAKLNHANIIRVKDLFDELGTSYYVMEYIDGQELHRATENNRDEATLRPLLRKLLKALDYLHGHALLHLDIKPSNILMTPQGEPVLIDFGTAQPLYGTVQARLKSRGYTPAEQLDPNGDKGAWTDLYALGATFCRVLTGDSPPDCGERLRRDTFIPLAERAELQAAYSPIFLRSIDKALQPKPENRWQTAGAWLAALDENSVTVVPSAPQKAADEPRDAESLLRQELSRLGFADIHEKTPLGETALHAACRDGNAATVRLLLSAGADGNAANRDGNTPLHEACYNGHTEAAKILLKAGANIRAKNKFGNTPLQTARSNGQTETANMLLEAGGGSSLLGSLFASLLGRG